MDMAEPGQVKDMWLGGSAATRQLPGGAQTMPRRSAVVPLAVPQPPVTQRGVLGAQLARQALSLVRAAHSGCPVSPVALPSQPRWRPLSGPADVPASAGADLAVGRSVA